MTNRRGAAAPDLDAPAADLVARFMDAAQGARGQSAVGLFETLKLEALDWRIDQGREAVTTDHMVEVAPQDATEE